jgi:hypothetical protein
VIIVAFGLAALILGRGRLFLRDWIPFLALFLSYELMRGYADKFGLPIHVSDIIALERIVGLGGLPTHLVQQLHQGPASAPDLLASLSVVFYFLHFPLPLVVGFLLWIRARSAYYDFVAALILLCLVGFVTFLVFPVAPPWLAAQPGSPYYVLAGPDGQPLIAYLKDYGFQALSHLVGFSDYFFSYAYYDMASNLVAAFPSLHAGFPFLAFLMARRAFGRAGWLVFGYFLLVVFSIVYLGDHYLVDVYGGIVYASAAYWAVIHAPGRWRAWLERLRDPSLEGGRRAIDRVVVGQGVVAAVVGAAGLGLVNAEHLGGSLIQLLPWSMLLAGGWRAAQGLFGRRA